MPRLPKHRHWRSSVFLKIAFFLLWLMGPMWLHSETISGTIKDSSGAVIAEARIEITGGDLAQAVLLSTDGLGRFSSPELKPGSYSLRITRDGFEPLISVVHLPGAIQLQLTLNVARQQVSVSVSGKSMAFANSDPLYRQLRDIRLGQTFHLDNYTLNWEAGTFQFQKGTLLKPGGWSCNRGDLHRGRTLQPETRDYPRCPRTQPAHWC